MNVLVVGGTRFVGRAIVESALERGHEVTLFNRGSHRDVLAAVPRVIGDRDRDADLAPLAGRDWDAVVDVSAYLPAQVRSLLHAVRDRTAHYLYISTVSVYADPVPPGAGEDAPLLQVHEAIPSDDPRAYGGRKVLCELAARDAIGGRLTVLRPTVVVGPHDHTDRFTWWVRHVARGGRIAVPARLDQPVQLIDAGDLGAFAVHALDHRILGTFNTVGPADPLTLARMIDLLEATFGKEVEVEPQMDDGGGVPLPLTLPADRGRDGAFRVSGAAAYRQGLTLRPLAETARAVLDEQRSAIES